jgi:hypothetical protein
VRNEYPSDDRCHGSRCYSRRRVFALRYRSAAPWAPTDEMRRRGATVRLWKSMSSPDDGPQQGVPVLTKLKTDFDEILELVNKTPAPLQELAFKMILEQWFNANTAPKVIPAPAPAIPAVPGAPGGVPEAIKPFLTANGITTVILEKAFHPTGPGAQLLVAEMPGDSRATKLSNLSLLLCVKQALESGSFSCTLKELRELAIHYNCYDSTNFSGTLKAKKNYYKPRDKGADLELSGPGLKKAGEVIKSIAAATAEE